MSSVSYSTWQANTDHHHQQQQQQQQNYNAHHLYQQPSNNAENSGPRAKCDQVIFEAIAKAAEIIVNGRSASSRGQQQQQQQHLLRGTMYGGGTTAGGSTTGSTTSSSRFNLIVPEIPGVRQILQRWRRALHVPLRLDLYYQNPNRENKRELLERWCLEYIPTSQDFFFERECRSSDPIVQLRHVCKKIVIWLRNLFCSSRLLPAQAFQHPSCQRASNIGFSIYFPDPSMDDLSSLVGFTCQNQPSTVLTPYGELVWKVYHSSKADIEPYLPPHHPFKAPLWMPREPSMAMPIRTSAPMAIPRNTSASGIDQLSSTPTNHTTTPIQVPQSAPAGGNYFPHPNNNNRMTDLQHNNPAAQQPRNTYHAPRHMMHHRSNSDRTNISMPMYTGGGEDHNHNNNHHHPNIPHLLLRRNTSIGIDEAAAKAKQQQQQQDEDMEHPERLLSGLSLALMSPQNGTNNPHDASSSDAVEKRRAALHHAPPHLMDAKQQQQQHPQSDRNLNDIRRNINQPTSAGEYGYAYNNHISWQQIRPSSNVPIALPGKLSDELQNNNNNNATDKARNSYSPSRGRLSSSPSPLAGTPPSGAFLRSVARGSTPPLNAASFIPPRNAAAPPFPTRPLGFANEPPAPLLATDPHVQAEQLQQFQQENARMDEMAPPMTSLDLLHSSPFQQGASVLSTLSAGAGVGGPTVNPQSSLLRPSVLNSTLASSSAILPPSREAEEALEYDMPFAVDLDSMVTANANTTTDATSRGPESFGGAADSLLNLGSSSAVASFAQKCAPAQHRLKLFETLHSSRTKGDLQIPTTSPDNVASSSADLTNQLAEFRNFGASLTLPSSRPHAGSGSGSDETGSTVTPIPLRTS